MVSKLAKDNHFRVKNKHVTASYSFENLIIYLSILSWLCHHLVLLKT